MQEQNTSSYGMTGLYVLDDLLKRQRTLINNMQFCESAVVTSNSTVITAEPVVTASEPAAYYSESKQFCEAVASREPNISKEPIAQNEPAPRNESKQPAKSKAVSNLVYYIAVIAALFIVFTISIDGAPKTFFGYSGFTVLTRSMQDVFPQGSFILTKQIDAHELKVGDDITFFRNDGSVVTHRIVGIAESSGETGDLAFETKGTRNAQPDKEIILERNIIGKVIWSNMAVGLAMAFVKERVLFIAVFAGLAIALVAVLRFRSSLPNDIQGKTRDLNEASSLA